MSSEKIREQFEAWITADASREDLLIRIVRERDWYAGRDKHLLNTSWAAWQASRAAVVVDLPEPYAVIGDYAACGGGRVIWDSEYAEKITDRMCEKTPVYDMASLIATGLKVKP